MSLNGSLGDFDVGTTIYGKFGTGEFLSNASSTFGGTPALAVYKNGSTVQSTAGVVLIVNFDSTTGLNHYEVNTSADASFYSADNFFDIVVTDGTVGLSSVVGQVVASFSLRKTSTLKPTVAGRTLDVSAGGEAGIDWGNVGSPSTSLNLSSTTIKTATDVETIALGIQAAIQAITVTGSALNTPAESYTLTAGVQSLNTYSVTAPLDGVSHQHTDAAGMMNLYYQFDIGSDGTPTSVTMSGRINGGNDSLGVYAYNWITANWDQIGTLVGKTATTDDTWTWTFYTSHVGFGGNVGKVRVRFYAASGLTAAIFSVDQIFISYSRVITAESIRTAVGLATANLDVQLETIDNLIDTEVSAIKTKTDNLPTNPAAISDIPSAASIATAVWDKVMSGSTTAIQAMRGVMAVLLGKASGLSTTTAVYRDVADTKDVVSATVDVHGNRITVTRDLS